MSNCGFWKPKPVSHRQVLVEETPTESSLAVAFNFSNAPLAQQRRLLPIYKHKSQLLHSLEKYAVVVVVGEPGSGKSTQLPAYCWENGWADEGFQVVCTQPRRIAAMTLAQRVSQEANTVLGQQVGYTVRFDDKTSPITTRVKFVTDGMLLREATQADPLLSAYSVIILDEAHERSLNSDALLGIVKKIRRKRPTLRVIVCSATIDSQAFLDFFVPPNQSIKKKRRRQWDNPTPAEDESDKHLPEGGTIISVDGRQHPVDVLYLKEPAPDYVRVTVETALRIHNQEEGAGDILAFLPSGQDIDSAIRLGQDTLDQTVDRATKKKKQVLLLPLYGTLPYNMQSKVFEPKHHNNNERRIIFATNMAETSVTVPDITHVIDCGYAKLPFFDPKTGFERLVVCPVSQASARQRAGRAGRVRPGKAYRLYTEQHLLHKMVTHTTPEVMRTNLTSFLLTLKALGVDNVLAFDLMDMPSVEALSHGLESLYALGALDDKTQLTNLGIDMSVFPTEPRVSRMLLYSLQHSCSWEVVSVASALQVRALFLQYRTQRQRLDFDAAMVETADSSGDHVTYANLLAEDDLDPEDCKERFVNYIALKRAMEVRNQLARFLRRYGRVESLGTVDPEERSKTIRRCVTAGFFISAAKLGSDGQYYTLRGKNLVKPSSFSVMHSHGDTSEYIIFCETHDGSRGGIEVRHCSTIHAKWLRDVAPHYWE